jgi:hypothetical protein
MFGKKKKSSSSASTSGAPTESTPTIGPTSGRGPRSTPARGYIGVSRTNERIATSLVDAVNKTLGRKS